MATQKIDRNMLNTGIVDNSNATAITIDSSENVTFAGAITSTGSSTFTSTSTMDINLVANPPELNFEDTSSTSGTKRARWTLDGNNFSAQGLSDNDGSVTQSLLNFSLSSGAATFGGTINGLTLAASGISGNASNNFALNTPHSFRLNIDSDSNATDQSFIIGNNQTAVNQSNVLLKVQEDGNVGIGTSAPVEKLDVSNYQGISVNSNYAHMGSTVSGAMAIFGHNIKSDSTANVIKSANNGYHSSMIKMYYNEGITFHATSGTQSAGDAFYNISGTTNELMRITNSGKVGIGTTTPQNNHAKANNLVVGSGSAGGMAVFNGTNEGWYAFSRANANNTDSYDGGMSYDGNRNLRLHTNSGSVRFLIDGSGNASLYGNLGFEDSKLLMFGGGTDARIYFDPSSNALMITASNGTANTVNITANNLSIGGANKLITGTANSSVVINENGADIDFRVESDDNVNMFHINAGANTIQINQASHDVPSNLESKMPNDKHDISARSYGSISGSGQPSRWSSGSVAVNTASAGTQLQIPCFSQPNLWRPFILKIMGVTGEYNYSSGNKGFEVVMSGSLLTSVNALTEIRKSGNVASIAASGMDIHINFTNAYNGGLSDYEGLVLHYELIGITPAYVKMWQAVMN